MSRRHKALWSVLPKMHDEYAYDKLSEVETRALLEALGDGFGTLTENATKSPPPSNVKMGLLNHPFFYAVPDYCDGTEEEIADAFWNSPDDGRPAPYEFLPIQFNRNKLAIYFENQYLRFCTHLRESRKDWATFQLSKDRWLFEDMAGRLLYQKPWYEFHAVQLFLWTRPKQSVATQIATSFAGQLGRLVEQYYWRFRLSARQQPE
jgi:hypothetical protein